MMMVEAFRGFKCRLYPTLEQEQRLRVYAGTCRFIYNLALEQREREWTNFRDNGIRLNFYQQSLELKQLRDQVDWIRAVPHSCAEQALRDVDTAFTNFFAGRARYPRPRKKGVHTSFRFRGRDCVVRRLNRRWGVVHVPKLGEVRFRWTRVIGGNIKTVTFSADALGWHVSFGCEVQIESVPSGGSIGIDRGVARTLALSDGSFACQPVEMLRLLDRRARKHSRALARCKMGSARRRKVKALLSGTRAKAARVRKHFNHEQSTRIAQTYGTVVIEALQTRSMTASAAGTIANPGRNVRQKAGLNRAILEQGWGQFEGFLAYKLAERGGELIKINPAYTSQTCSECGSISRHHRKSQAVFECGDCGHRQNADHNAARNILQAGTRPSVRELVAAPVDPRISERLT